MNRLWYTLAAGLMFSLAACEQNESDLPAGELVSEQAKASLASKYPGAVNVRWTSKGGYVVADFSLPAGLASRAAENVSNDLAAWFDNGGAWYMTETDIPFTALPEAVRTAFAESGYGSAPWNVDEVDKLEREGVETVYVIQVVKNGDGVRTEVDLYYSPDGVLVKQVMDAGSDYDYGDYIPSKPSVSIDEYIRTNHPSARIIDIDYEKGMTEVEILEGRTCRDLLFDGSGTWQYTKTEVRPNEVPAQVKNAFDNSEYGSGYFIDDIDHYKTAEREFYRYDLEARKGDVKVDFFLDGSHQVVEGPGFGNGGMVNAAINGFIASKYPGATILEYDYDDGLLEVEIYHDGRKKDVYFNGANAWVGTEWEIRPNELPTPVSAAIANSQWAAFEIDDVDFVQTPSGEYYLVELERGESEKELRIKADGTVL